MARLVVKCDGLLDLGLMRNHPAAAAAAAGFCREMIMEILSSGPDISHRNRNFREFRQFRPKPVHYLGFADRMGNDLWINEL